MVFLFWFFVGPLIIFLIWVAIVAAIATLLGVNKK